MPTLACTGTDEVAASFERDLQRSLDTEPLVTVVRAWPDPLDVINVTFRHVELNPILASFQRGLYREGVYAEALPIRYDDPLRAINVALWQEMGDRRTVHMVSASYN